ncbi:MAG: hypothetical protein NE327_00540 [Lentisphaeraceae bacterium]|nr:hypothetical protein [Lentisphaeraceae bacterium]
MNVVENTDQDQLWDSVGINKIDFRPRFDGYLYNFHSTLNPSFDEFSTEKMFIEKTHEVIKWVLNSKGKFNESDKFQIILGWPKEIRSSARQVIKVGGSIDDLMQIQKGNKIIKLTKNWSLGIFNSN